MERLIPEIAGQDEIEILRHLIPSEAEERVFGLEVADLQDTEHWLTKTARITRRSTSGW